MCRPELIRTRILLKSKMNDYIKYEGNRQNVKTKAKNYTVLALKLQTITVALNFGKM